MIRVDIQKQNTTTALNNHIKTQLFLFILSATVVNQPKNHSSVPDHNSCKSSSPLQPQTPRQQQLFITPTTTAQFLITTIANLPCPSNHRRHVNNNCSSPQQPQFFATCHIPQTQCFSSQQQTQFCLI